MYRFARRQANGKAITILGAHENNLKHIDVSFPLGVMTVVTGVSGSGKSTLVNDILVSGAGEGALWLARGAGRARAISGHRAHRQSDSDRPVADRAHAALESRDVHGVFTPIRDLYAMLPESRERGYKPGRFSFNVKGGRCEACQGDGPAAHRDEFSAGCLRHMRGCRGTRYNPETLAVRYKGYSIADLLDMPVEEALPVLENIPQIQQKLQTLVDVGLGYVQLGQSATTLSGGEAQRIKLARELSKRQTGRTLYILDEPTTGLHFDDVRKLLDVLNRLVDLGNTVLIIEHHLDVIKQRTGSSTWGPRVATDGGRIVAQGTPEHVARTRNRYTGQALAKLMAGASNGKSA